MPPIYETPGPSPNGDYFAGGSSIPRLPYSLFWPRCVAGFAFRKARRAMNTSRRMSPMQSVPSKRRLCGLPCTQKVAENVPRLILSAMNRGASASSRPLRAKCSLPRERRMNNWPHRYGLTKREVRPSGRIGLGVQKLQFLLVGQVGLEPTKA